MHKTIAKIFAGLSLMTEFTHAENFKIEEVIVTAQKQEENVQTIPLSISVMTSNDLINKGITSYEGVATATPSISFTPYPSSSNTLILYMRGQGLDDPGQIGSDGAVGLYEDGFYIARPQAATFDLADVERVEILRGPQGTLYGRNTTGGAVNLISKQPTGSFGFKQEFSAGSRNSFRSLSVINLREWNDVAIKLVFLKSSRDGYVKNTGAGHDYGEEAQLAGRSSVHWEITSAFQADYFFEKGSLDSTPVYYQAPALNGQILFAGIPYYAKSQPMHNTYRPVDLELSTSDFEGHGLTLSWNINESNTIKLLTGYRKLNYDAHQDYVEVFGFPYQSVDIYDTYQFSEELQYAASFDTLNYVAGLYYFKEAGFHRGSANLADIGLTTTNRMDIDSQSSAAYGQASWSPAIFDQRIEFVLGARYTRDTKEAERFLADNFNGVTEANSTNKQRFSRFNPSFTLNYKWTPDLISYAKVSTGYRAGGSYSGAPRGQFAHTFGPENLVNYELGLKSFWLQNRLRLNISAFDSKLEDMQLVIPADPGNPSVFQAYNAGKASIAGGEVELQFVPIEDFSLSLDYAYLNASFDRVDVIRGTVLDQGANPLSPYRVGDNVKQLFSMPYAPRHSFSLSGDYLWLHFNNSDFSIHLDYRWQDRIFQTPTSGPAIPNRDIAAIPAYGLLNGRLTGSFTLPRGNQVKIGIWGKNIANKNYHQSTLGGGGGLVPIQSVDPVTGLGTVVLPGYTFSAPSWAPPPSYGLDLSFEY